MLDFFRKYQRYFFIVITIVIVISFSFFGSYGALDTQYPHEEVVFKAIDGKDVKRQELDEMTQFISSDAQDKLIFGGVWGPNFFNDGVIAKNFLQTGMGIILAENFKEDLIIDLKPRLEKEKYFTLYSTPQHSYINVEGAWNYFSPEMKGFFNQLKLSNNPVDTESLAARFSLFLMEKQFPAPLLKQVLKYQQQQANAPMDPNLDYADLSLFGYHTLEDWFGPRFVRIAAQFIINSAKIAEAKGYVVSKEEAKAEMMNQAAISYSQNSNNPNLGVASLQQYVDEQLRRMNLDKNRAVNIVRQILLFKRLYADVGNSIAVDTFSVKKLGDFSEVTLEGELFELPPALRLNNYQSMQRLEAYIQAVGKKNDALMLPEVFLSVDEVAKKYPELVQHSYLLNMAKISKKNLLSKVGVKETWEFEVQEKNWQTLKNKFPELAAKNAKNEADRYAALDSLDQKTRNQVDAFARGLIVDTHPEWIEQSLKETPLTEQKAELLEKGGKIVFGDEKRKEIIGLLDKASLRGETPNEEAIKLQKYSADNQTFYRIEVISREPNREILTFEAAEKHGVLGPILDNLLETHYKAIRESLASQYKKPDGSWKSLSDVKDLVADSYFAKIKKEIEADYIKAIAPEKAPNVFLGDYLASLRLYAYMRKVKVAVEKDPSQLTTYVNHLNSEKNTKTLKDQWKLIRSPHNVSRNEGSLVFNVKELFNLKTGDFSKVYLPANGDISFFKLDKLGSTDEKALKAKVMQLHEVIANDAKRAFMEKSLLLQKEKNAINLQYMNRM